MQAHAVHPLQAIHGIMITAPDGLRTVRMLFDLEIHRHEGCGAVVLRPIELDAPGNPWPCEADECGFDDILAVKEVVAVCFVQANMDAEADFRKHHDPNKFVLDVQGLPGVLAGFTRNSVCEGQRVNAPTAALIDPFLKEHWVLVRTEGKVGRDDDWLAPCFHRARLRGRSCGQLELFHRAFLQRAEESTLSVYKICREPCRR